MNVGAPAESARRPRHVVACLIFVCAATIARGQTVKVRAERDGSVVRLEATVRFAAPPAVVWSVLTDYDGQGRFVPGIAESRVLSRDSTGSVVEQRGSARVLCFSVPFDVVYETFEQPPTELKARLVRGTVRRMNSSYRLSADGGGTRLDYAGEVEVAGWLPPLIGPAVVRQQVERQLEAIAKEIARRVRE